MAHRVCPWWLGYLLASPLRRWMQNPERILAPYIREGMTVLEPGPGMGFFTLDLARLLGPSGKVIAIDVQPKMIAALQRRARKANLADRIEARVTSAETMGSADVAGNVDFVLAFAVVHELPNAARFFAEVSQALKPGAEMLLAEPIGHVDEAAFEDELKAAALAQLEVTARPVIRRSNAALLSRKAH
jgi:SAM-dependent methyltransferase